MRRVLFALMFASTGCYTYSHVEAAAPSAAEVVRVELTDAGTVAIAPALGESVQTLEGPVIGNSGGSLQLDVRLLRRRGESLMKEWPGDHISIASSNIRSVAVKTLDRRKSTAAVVGATVGTVAAVLILAKATSIFGGGGGKIINTNVR